MASKNKLFKKQLEPEILDPAVEVPSEPILFLCLDCRNEWMGLDGECPECGYDGGVPKTFFDHN